jgi:hypothetical protein
MHKLFYGLIRLWTIRLMLTGTILILFGTGLNHLVIHANGNIMPVAIMREEILFVIGTEEYIDGFELVGATDSAHRKMTNTDKLSFLSDRILIIPTRLGSLLANMCTILRLHELCPLSVSLRMASIGDLFIWTGVPFLFLSLVVLLKKIIIRLYDNYIRKTTRT